MYDPIKVETSILAWWGKNNIYPKVKDKGRGKTKYYFLEGPPYTSGRIHIGTAWNKSLKDMVLRFKRMAGYEVWDRAGYDMHGLPTEHKVQDKFQVRLKEDIIKFGVAKFVQECEKFCVENMNAMNKDFTRMGVWLDFENAFMSIAPEFIDGVWWMIKKAHENKRLYEGLRTMTWCSHCETSVAKHELEYEDVNDESIYVKFPADEEKTYYVIWTTTPWTIPYNLCIMANPTITYSKVKVKDEVWIMAKELAAKVAPEGKIIDEFVGAQLEGKSYTHPLKDKVEYGPLKEKSPKVHTIVLSDQYVNLEQGTGLVHCAPGCGPEDYEVGHKNGIAPFNTLDERGKFTTFFKGWTARKDDGLFTQELDHGGALVNTEKYHHEYPHCWRCHQPVVFRTTKQWFFMMEDLKEKALEANNKIEWVPQAAKNAFHSWLENLRDNSITKQNFWGTPLPVWRCEKCQKYDVIGSIQEIEEKANTKIANPHKPWIDDVTYPCECGDTKKRLPDIIDVWLDAGSASWNCLDFPKRDDLFKAWWPAEWIIEGKDQIRGWFNLLMVASMITMEKPSFKKVYMHGFVQDSKGRKMSKSLGNYISPSEVIDKHGADTFRYYAIGSAAPALDMMYNEQDVVLKYRNLVVLWNLHNYLLQLRKETELPHDPKLGPEERYVQSRLHTTIQKVTKDLEDYQLPTVPIHLESFFLELSRDYGQWTRERVGGDDKATVLWTLYESLLPLLKMFGTVTPFICEKIYQNLKGPFNLKEESLHLHDWPSHEQDKINPELEAQFSTAKSIIAGALAVRDKLGKGLKWPLQELVVTGSREALEQAKLSEDLIKQQVNVREIRFEAALPGLKSSVKANFGTIKRDFGKDSPAIIAKLTQELATNTIYDRVQQNKVKVDEFQLAKDHFILEREVPEPYTEAGWSQGHVYLSSEVSEELETEGFAREIMRRFQILRKEAGLKKHQAIDAHIQADKNMVERLQTQHVQIAEKIGATVVTLSTEPISYPNKAAQKIKGKELTLFLKP